MSDVVLTIAGRAYTVACAAGEESHIAALGRIIDDKLSTLPGGSGKNDSRSLLFAALLLADELFELRHAEAPDAQTGPPRMGEGPPPGSMIPPDQLKNLAERLEALADAMEASV